MAHDDDDSKKTPQPRKPLEPIVLPNVRCRKCGLDHPDRLMMNTQECAGYLRLRILSVYTMKSRKILPPTVRGRKNPFWVPCDLARYLFPRDATFLRSLVATKRAELAKAPAELRPQLEEDLAKLLIELARATN